MQPWSYCIKGLCHKQASIIATSVSTMPVFRGALVPQRSLKTNFKFVKTKWSDLFTVFIFRTHLDAFHFVYLEPSFRLHWISQLELTFYPLFWCTRLTITLLLVIYVPRPWFKIHTGITRAIASMPLLPNTQNPHVAKR